LNDGHPGVQELVTADEVAAHFAEVSPETTRTRQLTWQDPVSTAALGLELDGIDYIAKIVAGEVPPPPIAVTMRFAPVEFTEGTAVFEGHPGEEHYNPIGVVHGGYASTLLDSAMGCAVHTTLKQGTAYTTLTLEVKLVRPMTRDTGAVRAEAKVLYRGRRQATVEGTLTEAATGKLLGTGTSTCMIMEV
jgi:uncharacterized protein (TIGR00369 family)